MTSDLRPTTIAPYTLGNIRWQCFITREQTYLWRSDCGRYTVWRYGGEWFGARAGKPGGKPHKDILSAMYSAQNEPGRAVA